MDTLHTWKLSPADRRTASRLVSAVIQDPEAAAYEIVGLRELAIDLAITAIAYVQVHGSVKNVDETMNKAMATDLLAFLRERYEGVRK
jgi:hypothetical protein